MTTQPVPSRPDGEPIPCRGCQYFTGPGCGCDNQGHDRPQNPGPRPGLDQISSDDFDTLYVRAENAEAELERMRQQLATWRATVAALDSGAPGTPRHRAERAEAAIRSALPDLKRAIDCLDATCRYHGDRLDPDEYGRRYRAEACCDTGVEPRRAREARQTLDRLRAALDEHQEQPAATPLAHIGGRANAEDCPACTGTNPPYPFICPGPKDA